MSTKQYFRETAEPTKRDREVSVVFGAISAVTLLALTGALFAANANYNKEYAVGDVSLLMNGTTGETAEEVVRYVAENKEAILAGQRQFFEVASSSYSPVWHVGAVSAGTNMNSIVADVSALDRCVEHHGLEVCEQGTAVFLRSNRSYTEWVVVLVP